MKVVSLNSITYDDLCNLAYNIKMGVVQSRLLCNTLFQYLDDELGKPFNKKVLLFYADDIKACHDLLASRIHTLVKLSNELDTKLEKISESIPSLSSPSPAPASSSPAPSAPPANVAAN